MTFYDIKNIMNRVDCISIGFPNSEHIIDVEKLFLNNDYRWIFREKGYFILDSYDIKNMIIFVNYNNDPKIMAFRPNVNRDYINSCNIILTDRNYDLLCRYFDNVPTYKPKSFIREI